MADAPTTRSEAYAVIDTSHKDIVNAIAGLTPEQLAKPVIDEWSAKDLLTHLTCWEEQMVLDYGRLGRGHMPGLATFKPDTIDNFNETLMSLRRAFSPEQVLAELESTRAELKRTLDSLDDKYFAAGFVPVTLVITADHEVEHAGHIREWRKRSG